jgi:PPOX class probable F420-dependent enzyme
MDDGEMRQKATLARVARLATMGPDNRPHLVPICFALAPASPGRADRLVSIVDDKPKRSARLQRLTNVRRHPAVSVLIDHYDDDWARLWWIRLDGTATVVEAGRAEHTDAAELLAAKYRQYRLQLPAGPVLAVHVQRWTGWAGAG